MEILFQYVILEYSDVRDDEDEKVYLRPENVPSDQTLEFSFGLKLIEYISSLYMGSVRLKKEFENPEYQTMDTVLRSRQREICVCLQFVKDRTVVKYKENLPLPTIEKEKKKKLRILVVDDNKVQVKIIVAMCERLGAVCDSAFDGEQAVSLCRANEYDAAIMDIVMPRLNGIDATKIIKELNPNMVVYGISANSFRSDFDLMLSAGAEKVYYKPVGRDELSQMLEGIADKKFS
jgi:CheY-like chemotaxis protein